MAAGWVEAALQAVEHGRVSTEDVLQKLTPARSTDMGAWLAKRVGATAPRRPTIRRTARIPLAVALLAVRRARTRWGKRQGVVSVHWGCRRVNGRGTGEFAVVVLVEQKLPPEMLKKRGAFPRFLSVRWGGRQHRIRVDVQPTGRGIRLHASPQTAPGNHAGVVIGDLTDGVSGTLSAIVTTDDGERHAVMSGHVAGPNGGRAWARLLDGTEMALGTVTKVIASSQVDAAWASPIDDPDNVLASDPAPVRDPNEADVNTAVRVYVRTEVTPRKAYVAGVGVTAPIYTDGSNTSLMQGLTAIDGVSEHGDSGSPVLDWNGNLIGFVLGAMGNQTYLIPARRALDALEHA
jgi:hypothetical protein